MGHWLSPSFPSSYYFNFNKTQWVELDKSLTSVPLLFIVVFVLFYLMIIPENLKQKCTCLYILLEISIPIHFTTEFKEASIFESILCDNTITYMRHKWFLIPQWSHNNLMFTINGPSNCINTWRPRQNGRRFSDNTFQRIFVTENVIIAIEISLKFVPKGPINNIPALVQIMAWRRPGDKPLSEPMMVILPTHICVTWPQWVKEFELSESLGRLTESLWCHNEWTLSHPHCSKKFYQHTIDATLDFFFIIFQKHLFRCRNISIYQRSCGQHGAHLGPVGPRGAPGGPHVGPINLAIRDIRHEVEHACIKWNEFRYVICKWIRMFFYTFAAIGYPARSYLDNDVITAAIKRLVSWYILFLTRVRVNYLINIKFNWVAV